MQIICHIYRIHVANLWSQNWSFVTELWLKIRCQSDFWSRSESFKCFKCFSDRRSWMPVRPPWSMMPLTEKIDRFQHMANAIWNHTCFAAGPENIGKTQRDVPDVPWSKLFMFIIATLEEGWGWLSSHEQRSVQQLMGWMTIAQMMLSEWEPTSSFLGSGKLNFMSFLFLFFNTLVQLVINQITSDEFSDLVQHPSDSLCNIFQSARWVWVIRLWSVLGMLIEFFVEPHWCLRHSTGRCPNSKFYMSDFPKFGQQSIWMLALNVIYFMPFVLDIGLRVLAYEGSFSTVSQRSYVAVVNIYALVSFIDYFGLPTFDVLAFCRPLIFLALHHTVRREVKVVLSSIPQVLELFFLGFLLLLFFALVAIILFPITTEEGRMYFPSLLTGMWSLLVLLTTANFPDVMLPAYRVSRAAFLYFFLFMIVGMFFLGQRPHCHCDECLPAAGWRESPQSQGGMDSDIWIVGSLDESTHGETWLDP